MRSMFRAVLAVSRKRRSAVVRVILRLLWLVHDIEDNEMYRFSDKLDNFNANPGCVSCRVYGAVEDDFLDCESTLEFLVSAIEDLEFAYQERF